MKSLELTGVPLFQQNKISQCERTNSTSNSLPIACPYSRNWTAPSGWAAGVPAVYWDFETADCTHYHRGAQRSPAKVKYRNFRLLWTLPILPTKISESEISAVADPRFPIRAWSGERRPQGGGADLLFGQIVPENCMNMKEIEPEGGTCLWRPPRIRQ